MRLCIPPALAAGCAGRQSWLRRAERPDKETGSRPLPWSVGVPEDPHFPGP